MGRSLFYNIHRAKRSPSEMLFNTRGLCENHGFTLMELLISLTILSIIVVIILGALRIGVRAWEKGEQDVDAHQRHRIVSDLIKQQLSSISLKKIKRNEESFFLKGDSKSLEFVSMLSLNPGNKFGNVYVKYVIRDGGEEKESLVFFEKNIVFIDRDFDSDDLDDDAFYELIPEVQSVAFEYLKRLGKEQEHEWQESWDPNDDVGLPLAIKIVFKEEVKTMPITMIVRIVPEEDT